MNRLLTTVVLMAAMTPALAETDKEKTCDLASQVFMYDRQYTDVKEGATAATVLARGIYKNDRCYTVMIEFYKKNGRVWHRRTVLNPMERELYAIYQQADGDESFACAVKIDGEKAHCLGVADFERVIQKHYGFDATLPSDATIQRQ